MPGWDLAVLDVVAGSASPTLHTAIMAAVSQRRIEAEFAVSLSLVVAREIRMHRALPEHDPVRHRRLAILERVRLTARDLLHTTT